MQYGNWGAIPKKKKKKKKTKARRRRRKLYMSPSL
jgi:hypothetical protein